MSDFRPGYEASVEKFESFSLCGVECVWTCGLAIVMDSSIPHLVCLSSLRNICVSGYVPPVYCLSILTCYYHWNTRLLVMFPFWFITHLMRHIVMICEVLFHRVTWNSYFKRRGYLRPFSLKFSELCTSWIMGIDKLDVGLHNCKSICKRLYER